MNPNLVLPVGTRIVTRVEVKTDAARALRPVGAVAEIVAIPADALHSYRVRFPDGAEASVRRREFRIWSQYREEAAGGPDPLIDHELFAQHVIYRCVVGSRAYGLDGPESDTDRRGIYLPPADLHWSLYGVPEQLENPDSQECYWELQKFLDLALKANPNVLECLWTGRRSSSTRRRWRTNSSASARRSCRSLSIKRTGVDLAVVDDGDELDDDERARLHATIARSHEEAQRGEVVPADEVLAKVRRG